MAKIEALETRTRTKIVATVGPACNSVAALESLIEAGADVFRVNMAHGTRQEHEEVVAHIRQAASQVGRPIAVLIDLSGPKIRLGELHHEPIQCAEGDEFILTRGEQASRPDQLVSNYPQLIPELTAGDDVMIADGIVRLKVIEADQEQARLRVVSEGEIRHRQGMALPGVKLSAPALTEADLDNAVWAASIAADFVSLSFVRSPHELHKLRELLRHNDSKARVIAKIEKREAVEQLEEIVVAADAVMVARGDLGVEIDIAETPVVQKRIVRMCRDLRKPVIVATQMLESMQYASRPTRAEVTDVANAILDGADACMLSGETAIGERPKRVVAMMNSVMGATERMLADRGHRNPWREADDLPELRDGQRTDSLTVHPITDAVVRGAAEIAHRLDAKLMVIATRSGGTALMKAKLRDMTPTIGLSDSEVVLRRMCLYWGIWPLAGGSFDLSADLLSHIDEWGRNDGSLSGGDRVVYVLGSGLKPGAHNQILVHEVD